MVYAYINHSRWVADCPRCNSAELVTPGQAKFHCGGTYERGGTWGCGFDDTLSFPSGAKQIERALSKRPSINQNWSRRETLKELLADNASHGIDREPEVSDRLDKS